MRPIPVLLVTYNRLEYSKQVLESILKNPGRAIDLTIWDNASTDGTQEWIVEVGQRWHYFQYLKPEYCAEFKYILSPKNVGLAPAMNAFFRANANEPFVAKVDNDTVLPDNWLADLAEVMEASQRAPRIDPQSPVKLGAISGTCLRPPGLTAEKWYGAMPRDQVGGHTLYYNPACLGTGVVINMTMIRERGLLFEKFPRSPQAAPDDPCLISGWGAYIQEATVYDGWRMAMYSKVPVRLLNLKEDQVLSNDYPEYDAEIKKVRDEGNAWWESVGGLPGVRRFVRENGGLEKLPLPRIPFLSNEGWKAAQRDSTPSQFLTEADNLEERSTLDFWVKRVEESGTTRSSFLEAPQARINEFTEKHLPFIHQYASGKDVLDLCCGWARMSRPIAQAAKSYVGVDFVPALIEKAKESMPELDFQVADAKKLPFESESFDVVVAIAALSSLASIFPEVLAELKRVLRPDGVILFLEENFARIDWKLRNS